MISPNMVKTVGDLLSLLGGLDPKTELWTQDVGDANECWPVINLPEIVTIANVYYGEEKMWRVYDSDDHDKETISEEDKKQVVLWNE